ncbi:hypothetical protein KIM372_06150 [Bombiscardovia nodaiensis]|uniref:Uncharacterized protein n=1 Tax=Bombiscardovia nodaiensis TaxID=2932181 RepID=A0ABM8B771_9BIFI|nr:hypothetical protein KIM372_06150 [Bombiscardovia nodaiensis]
MTDSDQADSSDLAQVNLMNFTRLPDSDDWTYTYQLPVSSADAQGRSAQGKYALQLHYQLINGQEVQAEQSFGVDYTGPQIADLHYALTGPQQWGWVFAPDSETITARSWDKLSGVNDASVDFEGKWSKLEPGQSNKPTSRQGGIELVFGQDSSRLELAGSHFTIKDQAGNMSAPWTSKLLPTCPRASAA